MSLLSTLPIEMQGLSLTNYMFRRSFFKRSSWPSPYEQQQRTQEAVEQEGGEEKGQMQEKGWNIWGKQRPEQGNEAFLTLQV